MNGIAPIHIWMILPAWTKKKNTPSQVRKYAWNSNIYDDELEPIRITMVRPS